MPFKPIEGTLANGNPRTLFRAIALSASQFAVVQSIIKLYDGQTLLTRKQLMDANTTINPGKIYMPYFIGRNMVCKTKTPGTFDLSRLKMRADAGAPPTPKKVAKKAKAKKETKAKREKKVHVPVVTPEGEMTPAGETLKDAVLAGKMSFTDAVGSILAG